MTKFLTFHVHTNVVPISYFLTVYAKNRGQTTHNVLQSSKIIMKISKKNFNIYIKLSSSKYPKICF